MVLHSKKAFLFFTALSGKLMQGHAYVILARPCIENDVLMHYLEEVTEQLD